MVDALEWEKVTKVKGNDIYSIGCLLVFFAFIILATSVFCY